MTYRAVVTDYNYPHLKEEKGVFTSAGIELIDASGECETEEGLIEQAGEADAILCQFVPITRKVIENLKKCRVIVRYAIGIDNIDLDAATERGIMVANVPDYCIEEVANHALTLMLSVVRKVTLMDGIVKRGVWDYKRAEPVYRLSTMNLGLIAFGKIARNLARKARAMGFNHIYVHDPYLDRNDHPAYDLVSLRTLLEESDVVSIHAPATEETEDLINKKTLALMRDGSFLVNTSRGSLVNEEDLSEALKSGKLAGAGLDVLKEEGVDGDHPLLACDNVVLTPHMAWYSVQATGELKRKAAEQIKEALLDGEPTYWVNRF